MSCISFLFARNHCQGSLSLLKLTGSVTDSLTALGLVSLIAMILITSWMIWICHFEEVVHVFLFNSNECLTSLFVLPVIYYIAINYWSECLSTLFIRFEDTFTRVWLLLAKSDVWIMLQGFYFYFFIFFVACFLSWLTSTEFVRIIPVHFEFSWLNTNQAC